MMGMEFAILDIETRIDKDLLNRVFFAGEGLSEQESYERFREELRERGGDFFPLTLHLPVSLAIGHVGPDHILRRMETLEVPRDPEEQLVGKFWAFLENFSGCVVTFNGRRFDLPVLELAAIRWRIAAPRYFDQSDSARSPHSPERHLDLCEYLTNYGQVGLRGGMDLLAKMVGLPGKQAMNGSMVQECFDAGRFDEIHRYCRTDVIQTYFLFLRVELMRGRLSHASYDAAYSASSAFLEELHTQCGTVK